MTAPTRGRSILAGLLLAPLLLAWLVAAGGPAAANSEPSGSIGIRLLDAPTNRADDPRATQFIVDHLPPGAVIERRIEISSTVVADVPVALYPAAVDIVDGEWRPRDGRAANELTSWMTVTPSEVTVPGGGVVVATVRVVVPSNPTPGEHYGVVWAELPVASSGSVRVVNRVGVRTYLSIGAGSEPPTDFDITSLTARRAADGSLTLLANAANIGGRAVDLSATIDLADGPGGVRAGPFDSEQATTLAPGESGAVTVAVPSVLPVGPWMATVEVRSGALRRVRAALITFPTEPGEVTVPFGATVGDPVTDGAAPGETGRGSRVDAGDGVLGVGATALALLLVVATAVGVGVLARQRERAGYHRK